jgi:hypothetical protein
LDADRAPQLKRNVMPLLPIGFIIQRNFPSLMEVSDMIKLRQLRCSFCGKDEAEVSKLVAGPRVYICDKCVAIASQIMSDSHGDSQPPKVEPSVWRKLLVRTRQFLRGGYSRRVNSLSVSG